MRILVTGGTGFVGSHLCRELVDRDHDVIALARTPEDASLPDAVETVSGDVTDRGSMAPAFDEADAVVHLVALSPLTRPRGGARAYDRVIRGGTDNVVRAAEAAGVGRITYVSAIHADPDAPTAYLRAKGQAERIVHDSDLDWTVVRPTTIFGDGDEFVGFVETVALPYLTPLPGGGRTRFQLLWVGDAAPMLANAVVDDRHLGETYEIGGSQVLTLAESARLIHRAHGRSVNVVPIPMPLVGLGMTVGGAIPGFPFGPDQYRGLRLDLVTGRNGVEALGADPADLATLEWYLGLETGGRNR